MQHVTRYTELKNRLAYNEFTNKKILNKLELVPEKRHIIKKETENMDYQ